jgi:hypothetical protein
VSGKPEKFENLLQASEKACGMPTHSAVVLTFK